MADGTVAIQEHGDGGPVGNVSARGWLSRGRLDGGAPLRPPPRVVPPETMPDQSRFLPPVPGSAPLTRRPRPPGRWPATIAGPVAAIHSQSVAGECDRRAGEVASILYRRDCTQRDARGLGCRGILEIDTGLPNPGRIDADQRVNLTLPNNQDTDFSDRLMAVLWVPH